MAFGKMVTEIRKAKGIKQKDLALKAKIPVTVLSKIENGKDPGMRHLKGISQALDIPYEIIMLLSLDENQVSDDKRELMNEVQSAIKDCFI